MVTPQPAGPPRRPIHAGDLRIEAWAASREACIAEAVDALVDSFLGPSRPAASARSSFEVAGDTDTEMLKAVLRQVIVGLREREQVPVATAVAATGQGLQVACRIISAASVLPASAIPKSVSGRGALCQQFASGWWCTARIDL